MGNHSSFPKVVFEIYSLKSIGEYVIGPTENHMTQNSVSG